MHNPPTSVMVVSILGIIYGAVIVLGAPCGIFLTFHPLTPNPAADALAKDSGYVITVVISSAINFCLGLLLLASSIGSLKLKPWARLGMNVYAVVYVITNFVGTIVAFVFVMPKMADAMANMPPAAAQAAKIVALIGGVFGFLIALAIALIILVTFNRRIARDAFQGIFPADPTNFPVDYHYPDPPLPPEG